MADNFDANLAIAGDKRGPWIGTYTGRKFHILDPSPDEIDIFDIAHALSNQCRFAGHLNFYYSVAQHCVEVSRELPPHEALKGLLHDASEAYIVDIPRPLKQLPDMLGYRLIEEKIENAIYERFGLDPGMTPAVKAADNLLAATEAWLFLGEPEWARDLPRLGTPLYAAGPKQANGMFLDRFLKLTPGLFRGEKG